MDDTRRLRATRAARLGAAINWNHPGLQAAPQLGFANPVRLQSPVSTLNATRPQRAATVRSPEERRTRRVWRDAAAQIARSKNAEPQLRVLLGADGSQHHREFADSYSKVMRERCEAWLRTLGKKQKLDRAMLSRWEKLEQLRASGADPGGLFELVFPEFSSACPCCAAHDFLADAQPANSQSWSELGREVAREYWRPISHASDLKFDPETSITTATESVVFSDVPARAVGDFFGGADPRNWDDSGNGEFFKSTEPGAWENGRFQPFPRGSAEYANWCLGGRSGLMQEIIEFPWSPTSDSTIEAETVLTISELKKEGYTETDVPVAEQAGGQADGNGRTAQPSKRTIATISAEKARLEYKYSLFVSSRSKYGVGSVPGGLDVDEGEFRATWTLTDEDSSGPRGVLEVYAYKSVHYTQPAQAAPGLGGLLNLMATSLTGLLMRELVFEGTRTALERTSRGGPPHPGPSTPTRQS